MQRLRAVAVSYLNTQPLVQGLDALREVEFARAVPSRIAPMIRSGEADIGLASIVDAVAREPGEKPLALLPCGMIGCAGPTLTVRVFSALPPEQITVLHADTDSHASVARARGVLQDRFGVDAKIVDFDARERHPGGDHAPSDAAPGPADPDEAWPEALLLIGDKVVTDSPPAVRYPHQIDLGEAWHGLTGLPFVYAAWMCDAERAADPSIIAAASVIERQRRRNAMRLDAIVQQHAPARGWPADLARDYVARKLRYALDDDARAGADRFIARCAELGVLPEGSALRWARSAPAAPAHPAGA